jgi:hypothetical protein
MSYAPGHSSVYVLQILQIMCNKCVNKSYHQQHQHGGRAILRNDSNTEDINNAMAQDAEILCCNIKGKVVPVLN